MKKKILYHYLRISDYVYALTNGNLRNSQLMAVIKEFKLNKVEFDEIKCILEMDNDFSENIFEMLRNWSSNNKSKKHYSTKFDFRFKLHSEILEENNEYNIETNPDGTKNVHDGYFYKRTIEKLKDITQEFFNKFFNETISFISIDKDEVQSKLLDVINNDVTNNDVYIVYDLTGEIFKDFYEYKDEEVKGLNFIINKNEFENFKPDNSYFKKNIFGTIRLPVNYYFKSRKYLKPKLEIPFHKILTNDEKLIEKLLFAKFIAKHDETVLILGKTGTGKELLAEGIHYESERSKKRFVPVNCSAIPDSLFESEMFGYREGAFTGAYCDKEGYFESANGGTLFLDEIGDLPPTHQAKVLRVLQEKKFKRIGEEEEIESDFRLICATNKDITEGEFRSDLYYRIANLTIQLPLLKDRDKSDIELLVSHFKDSIKTKYGKYYSIEYSKKSIQSLTNYPWPGNVRQLKSFVYETFFWTAFKVKPKYAEKPIKNLDPKEPIYNTFESVIMGEPNYQDEEPLYEETPIIIDDDFVNQSIEAQKIKEAKNKYLDSDIYSKIIDENITARDLPSNFNINAVIDEIKINYIKKLIKADMNQKDIGKKFGVKQQTVSTWLRDYGIK